MASEKVSLFGLTIVPERRVRYAAIDPAASRELFIQHGLVEGDFDTRAEFFRHNRQLLDEPGSSAAKTRRRELIVDPHMLYRLLRRPLAGRRVRWAEARQVAARSRSGNSRSCCS